MVLGIRRLERIAFIWTFFQFCITTSYSNPSEDDLTHHHEKRFERQAAGNHEDYSNGFPSGFTQGLPTFDFSGPMTSSSHSEQSSADSENVGFVQGPPDGFPSLSQLGGDFPTYAGSEAHQQFQQSQGSAPSQVNFQRDPTRHESEYSPPGPGPTSIRHHSEANRRPPPPSYRQPPKPLRLTKLRSRPPGAPPPQYRPEPGASGSGGHGEYTRAPAHGQYEPQHQQGYAPYQNQNQPIVLKVSSKKIRPTKLPPPPPPFYAPSPDTASTKDDGNPSFGHPHDRQQPHYHNRRTRREISASAQKEKKNVTNGTLSDQIQDGTDDTYWEVSSPFIAFDNYEDEKSTNIGHESSNRSSSDHDAGEQRFFPSFPATNPYLSGLHPYITAPVPRPPLFPGPSANRSPSRIHQQFGPKYANAQRGPSGVYTAESHDHGDRYVDNNLLGSGNFEVVRGGTFYEDEENYHPGFLGNHHQHNSPSGEDSGDYYHHNGHSSPSGFGQHGNDFFANFRDFADINPHSRAFSHNHETTVNLETAASEHQRADNILDKLKSRSLDLSSTSLAGASKSIENDPMMATY